MTDWPKFKTDPALLRLLQESKAKVEAMSPEELEEMLDKQRKSWVRGEIGMAEEYRKHGGRD
jgi:hypothetical protein